jgi:hypothetical protein
MGAIVMNAEDQLCLEVVCKVEAGLMEPTRSQLTRHHGQGHFMSNSPKIMRKRPLPVVNPVNFTSKY